MTATHAHHPDEDREHVAIPDDDSLALTLAEDVHVATLSYRDPDAVAVFAQDLRRTVRANVTRILDAAAGERIETDRPTPSTYAPELQVAADLAETLTEVADAVRSGVEVAHDRAALILDEFRKPHSRSVTHTVADGHGRDLKVSAVQGTELSVDVDEVIDVLVETAATSAADDLGAAAQVPFRAGVRAGIDEVLTVLASPKFKSTALDQLVRDLQDAGETELGIRLSHAYGRVDKGEPRLKLERVEPKPAKAGAR